MIVALRYGFKTTADADNKRIGSWATRHFDSTALCSPSVLFCMTATPSSALPFETRFVPLAFALSLYPPAAPI